MRAGDVGGRVFSACHDGMDFGPTYRPRKTVIRCGCCGQILRWDGTARRFVPVSAEEQVALTEAAAC